MRWQSVRARAPGDGRCYTAALGSSLRRRSGSHQQHLAGSSIRLGVAHNGGGARPVRQAVGVGNGVELMSGGRRRG